MEKIIIEKDIPVFGVQVKTFPLGIGEAFEKLAKMIPGGFNRSYYGISSFINGTMSYYAMAEEKSEGEAEKYSCLRLAISKGEYLSERIAGWRSKTDSISYVFHELMKHEDIDDTKPAVEWYKDDEEMFCMLCLRKQSFG